MVRLQLLYGHINMSANDDRHWWNWSETYSQASVLVSLLRFGVNDIQRSRWLWSYRWRSVSPQSFHFVNKWNREKRSIWGHWVENMRKLARGFTYNSTLDESGQSDCGIASVQMTIVKSVMNSLPRPLDNQFRSIKPNCPLILNVLNNNNRAKQRIAIIVELFCL